METSLRDVNIATSCFINFVTLLVDWINIEEKSYKCKVSENSFSKYTPLTDFLLDFRVELRKDESCIVIQVKFQDFHLLFYVGLNIGILSTFIPVKNLISAESMRNHLPKLHMSEIIEIFIKKKFL